MADPMQSIIDNLPKAPTVVVIGHTRAALTAALVAVCPWATLEMMERMSVIRASPNSRSLISEQEANGWL